MPRAPVQIYDGCAQPYGNSAKVRAVLVSAHPSLARVGIFHGTRALHIIKEFNRKRRCAVLLPQPGGSPLYRQSVMIVADT